MTRLNIILFFTLILSGLGLVNSQHKARNLYFSLERLNQVEKQYEQEYGQLQLEQSTWALQSRIEQVATQQLQMQVPEAARVQVVTLDNNATLAVKSAEPQPVVDASLSGAVH
jgi:cell division protein FtsL